MHNLVRHFRKILNMTQKEVAIAAKVGRSSISEIESGKRIPYVDTAIYISHALGRSVEALFPIENMKELVKLSKHLLAYREVALIARDVGILKSIPENSEVLVFLVDKLFEHISVIAKHSRDDFATTVTE